MYNPKEIEKKWQDIWREKELFKAEDLSDKEKVFLLVEFPYPSGDGLHVGHVRPYTALDVVARKRRLEGYNVLYPMGWDAFGLPTENFAIKHKVHPRKVTEKNVANYKRQLNMVGLSFDWSREINTTDPEYYKWTQWIFLKLFEKGLAYKKEMPINWCESCKIGLANEEVVNGTCERCGGKVVQKTKSQWMLKITEYADKLIDDLEEIDYIPAIKTQQINWIGRSYGMEIIFKLDGLDEEIKVFTTRPDTLFGVSYMVLAPEHPLIDKYKDKIENIDEVLEYREKVSLKSDLERTELSKEKTGLPLKGLYGINPANDELIPIWVSDYVLMGYGTGAVMAVPGHDQRDYEFAKENNLDIFEVVEGGDLDKEAYTETKDSKIINSDFLNGLDVETAKEKIAEYLETKSLGKKTVNYKLRDWIFSRQRYWGEPIPLVYCPSCGWVPVPEDELPVELPDVDNYEPSENGESPLANITDWVETTCPKCGGNARRETDTMPNWAGSSWYYLRYIDPKNDKAFADRDKIDYWMNVDWYNGGMEHTTLHLLYSRFWHKFLYDLGLVNTKEPYKKRTAHGMIIGEGNVKMSKSLGNVINPDGVIEEFGADTLRTYEMFLGDFEQSAIWSTDGVRGARRFLDRVYRLSEIRSDKEEISEDLETDIHKTIKKVTEDYESLKYNTAIAALMSLSNKFYDRKEISKEDLRIFLLLLNPVAPHITEEIWEKEGLGGMLHESKWPSYDESKLVEDVIEMPVQISGKVRTTIMISPDASEEEVFKLVEEEASVKKHLEGKNIVKRIYIPGRIINIVVK